MATTKLKEIRERNNLTQLEMGDLLHIGQSAYQKLESGQTSLRKEHIIQIIKEFGENASDLLDSEGIEIVFKDNASNNGTINGKAVIENFNNFSK